jgi:hypothetical protein
MLKLSKKHEIYEVWNEWAAESVFVDHKPTKAEVLELVELNDWYHHGIPSKKNYFIKRYIHVEQLEHFYTYDKHREG